jgi:hypothetical protein
VLVLFLQKTVAEAVPAFSAVKAKAATAARPIILRDFISRSFVQRVRRRVR